MSRTWPLRSPADYALASAFLVLAVPHAAIFLIAWITGVPEGAMAVVVVWFAAPVLVPGAALLGYAIGRERVRPREDQIQTAAPGPDKAGRGLVGYKAAGAIGLPYAGYFVGQVLLATLRSTGSTWVGIASFATTMLTLFLIPLGWLLGARLHRHHRPGPERRA